MGEEYEQCDCCNNYYPYCGDNYPKRVKINGKKIRKMICPDCMSSVYPNRIHTFSTCFENNPNSKHLTAELFEFHLHGILFKFGPKFIFWNKEFDIKLIQCIHRNFDHDGSNGFIFMDSQFINIYKLPGQPQNKQNKIEKFFYQDIICEGKQERSSFDWEIIWEETLKINNPDMDTGHIFNIENTPTRTTIKKKSSARRINLLNHLNNVVKNCYAQYSEECQMEEDECSILTNVLVNISTDSDIIRSKLKKIETIENSIIKLYKSIGKLRKDDITQQVIFNLGYFGCMDFQSILNVIEYLVPDLNSNSLQGINKRMFLEEATKSHTMGIIVHKKQKLT